MAISDKNITCRDCGSTFVFTVGEQEFFAEKGFTKLTEPEVDVVLAYIKAWWNEEQRESQADISRRYQEALDKQKKR